MVRPTLLLYVRDVMSCGKWFHVEPRWGAVCRDTRECVPCVIKRVGISRYIDMQVNKYWDHKVWSVLFGE